MDFFRGDGDTAVSILDAPLCAFVRMFPDRFNQGVKHSPTLNVGGTISSAGVQDWVKRKTWESTLSTSFHLPASCTSRCEEAGLCIRRPPCIFRGCLHAGPPACSEAPLRSRRSHCVLVLRSPTACSCLEALLHTLTTANSAMFSLPRWLYPHKPWAKINLSS